MDKLTRTTTIAVINKIKALMAPYDSPDRVSTDNRAQFDEFTRFSKSYNFRHTTSSLHYPQASGKAENSVKTTKSILPKAFDSSVDTKLALLDICNTPTEGMGISSAQRVHS